MRGLRMSVLWVSSGMLGAGAAGAQTPQELTVEEAVRLGLRQNVGLEVVRAEAREAEAVHRELRGTRLPAVRTQASYTRLGGEIPSGEFTLPGLDTTFTLLPIERNRYHTEVSVEHPLFSGGRLRNRVAAAGHRAEAAGQRIRQGEADVAFEIRRAYWNLALAQALREALDAALAQVDEHVRIVRARVEAGAALTSELLAAQTRRSEVALERVDAENAVQVGRLELNRLVGLPAGTVVRPTGVIELAAQPAPAVPAGEAIPAGPGLSALEEQVRAFRAEVGAAAGAWLPEVAMVGRYVYARPNPYAFTEQDEFRGTWEAGLALRWSLWEGGQRPARAAQARARLRGAEARLAQAREEVAVEESRRQLEVRRAAEAVEVADQMVREAEETLRVVSEQYAEGAALSAQVLDAESAYRAAQSRRVASLAEYAIAGAAVLHARGEVW